MIAETREQWLARKREKEPFGNEYRWEGSQKITPDKARGVFYDRAGQLVIPEKGMCPCGRCKHEYAWDCDPNGGAEPIGCACCEEVCT